MLTPWVIGSSLFALSIMSCLPGYLVISYFQRKQHFPIGFFAQLPIFLSVGLCLQVFVSYLVGIFTISSYVNAIISIFSGIVILVWKRKTIVKDLGPMFYGKTLENILSVLLLLFLFVYFANIPIITKWPPIGDAITHGMLTSLSIFKGKIPTDLNPLQSLPNTYPTGYHVFAADLSLSLNLNPGEAVYLLATYVVILIAGLLFTVGYYATKSYWIALPLPFVILFIHQSNSLEMWLAGYLFNGPFPNLFGFMTIITILALCHKNFINNQRISNIATILVILLATIFFVYPIFLTHGVLLTLCYYVIQKFDPSPRRTYAWIRKRLSKSSCTSLPISKQTMQDEICLETPRIKYAPIFVLAGIIILVVSGGVLNYYYNIIAFNSHVFIGSSGALIGSNEAAATSNILPQFLSDNSMQVLFVLGGVASFAVMLLERKMDPLSLGYLLLFGILISGFVLISAQRTLVLLSLMSWLMISYAVSKFLLILKYVEGKPQRFNRLGRQLLKTRLLNYAILSGFVFFSFYTLMPSIKAQASGRYGWQLYTFTDFDANYNALEWLKKHAHQSDLILNDRSYSSLFMNGFAIRNLVFSYWSSGVMTDELKAVWNDPNNEAQVLQLLKKYDVKYIVILNEYGYFDSSYWHGSGKYLQKPHSTVEYEKIFSSYKFLQLQYRDNLSLIYSVR